MISIKAISAIALTGLGAATVSTDVYLANQKPRAPMEVIVPIAEAPPPPSLPQPSEAPVANVPAPPPPLQIEPVLITGRRPAARMQATKVEKVEKKQEFVACTDWRSLSSGPESRGVRTLCLRDVE